MSGKFHSSIGVIRAVEECFQVIAEGVDEALETLYGERRGFVLLTFEFDAPGLGAYVSNGNRSDVVHCLREFLDRYERGEMIGRAEGEA